VALENHDHAYKRTKLLFNNDIVDPTSNQHGVLYVGDGAMGVKLRDAPTKEPQPRWYVKEFEEKQHYLILDTSATCVNVTAVAEDKEIFDTTRQCW
jgi:hypothetical protein